ncbi:MAG TPA: FliA/WhiG family RNA polymerase sigma factor [Gemmatimonadaceae bacterium]|nr:FliA/WhiG family RNA polymerase sigma factor [Gemmatimonadaceae bacterium]
MPTTVIPPSAAAVDLWAAMAAGDVAARDTLVQDNLNLVHHVAQQVARSLSSEVDADELVSAGVIGLINAVGGFEPQRGLAFSTFAVPRIRGAILDELRRQDHVPRSVRRKTREIGAAQAALSRELGRPAEDREVAAHLGIDLRTFWRWQADVESAVQVPLDRPSGDGEGYAPSAWDLMTTDDAESVEDAMTRDQERELLRRALLGLTEQERTILTLYYFEELKLHEIAEVLGLTESRVSQVRTKALRSLQDSCRKLRA